MEVLQQVLKDKIYETPFMTTRGIPSLHLFWTHRPLFEDVGVLIFLIVHRHPI